LRQRSNAPSVLRPVNPPRNLTRAIAERIAGEIAAGKLAPGARLPTEQEMVAAMGVSRTVVREAVATLRAEGLVTTRQGAGAFVAADAARRPFRLALDGLPSIGEVLDIMELRAGVEVDPPAPADGSFDTLARAIERDQLRLGHQTQRSQVVVDELDRGVGIVLDALEQHK